ncbi:P-loop containing nucleoside triphosphate hydrolase protein [Mycena vitilis]|nr:P-loop containing nucleoside triphosphate hydrolase protein [Mycena vitilis]
MSTYSAHEPEKGGAAGLSTLAFEHLSYRVQGKGKAEGKLLVDDVSVTVKAGELLAIMVCKSTLLDLMCFRKTPLEGAVVSLNGERLDARRMQQMSTFVEQEDALLGVLTVRESVGYALRLHLPLLPARAVAARVDRVLTALGLQGCAHQRIGTAVSRGISGGQKRRVTAACAMVTFPRILLLDEVTSGLDSTSAFEVLSAIRTLARAEGIVVLASIHQPAQRVLEQFTSLLLLSAGQVCYAGRVGDLAGFLERGGRGVSGFTTPADHAMTFLNDDFADAGAAPGSGAKAFREYYLSTLPARAASPSYANSRSSGSGVVESGRRALPSPPRGQGHEYPPQTPTHSPSNSLLKTSHTFDRDADADADYPPYGRGNTFGTEYTDDEGVEEGKASAMGTLLWNTLVLAERTAVNYSRNLLAYGVRAGMYAGMGFMLATIWIRLGSADSTINDRLSVHFYSVAFLAFMSVAGIPGFLEERAVYYRESKNGLYSTLPFLLSNTLVNMPFLFVCTLLFSLICYWAIGLHPGGAAFFRFLGFLYLAILAAESQMLVVAAMLPIFVAALAIGAFVNGFWMSVGGYFIKARSLPRFWYYSFHYMDYQRYAFELLANSDFRGLTFNCVTTLNGTCTCAYPSSTPDTCTVSGADVLSYLDVLDISYGSWAAILLGIIVIYRVALYFALKLRSQ